MKSVVWQVLVPVGERNSLELVGYEGEDEGGNGDFGPDDEVRGAGTAAAGGRDVVNDDVCVAADVATMTCDACVYLLHVESLAGTARGDWGVTKHEAPRAGVSADTESF
ncbi:unnamed protein product [Phytophthora fragariaefolia]|uniref:Unnamed protein product n=1 Tax=Phytophthora fragariaefolia TaxID=1490495 RepID=A0A9W7CUA7_9STRA|nr:unnamed protein product [Phytophthora fragariaefolia]